MAYQDLLSSNSISSSLPKIVGRDDRLREKFAGSSAPAGQEGPVTGQWWVDTSVTPNLLKLRNTNNDAWVTIGSIDDDGFKLLSKDGGTMEGDIDMDGNNITVPSPTLGGHPVNKTYFEANGSLAGSEIYYGRGSAVANNGGGTVVNWSASINIGAFTEPFPGEINVPSTGTYLIMTTIYNQSGSGGGWSIRIPARIGSLRSVIQTSETTAADTLGSTFHVDNLSAGTSIDVTDTVGSTLLANVLYNHILIVRLK